MPEIVIIWDDEDDRDGNYWHICVDGHGLAREEIEDVLRDDDCEIEVSRSSGRPTAFGWTRSGERIAVVFEEMSEAPRIVYPVTAYPVPPKGTKKEIGDEDKTLSTKEMDCSRACPAQSNSQGIRELAEPG